MARPEARENGEVMTNEERGRTTGHDGHGVKAPLSGANGRQSTTPATEWTQAATKRGGPCGGGLRRASGHDRSWS